MSDSLRQVTSSLPLVASVRSQEQNDFKMWVVYGGLLLAHLCLIWEINALPAYFQPFDLTLSVLAVAFMVMLAALKTARRLDVYRLVTWLLVGNVVFLLVKLGFALFWVGSSERIVLELVTTSFWSFTAPLLVASFRLPLQARWLAWVAPLLLVLLALLYWVTPGGRQVNALVWFSFLQVAVAGGLVLLASLFMVEYRRHVKTVRQNNQMLGRLAFFDDLTGLHNRTYLDQRLQELCQGRDPLAVLFADLDGFKAINDSMGHATGDEVLRILAARLKEMGHATACLARVSGDEFVVVLCGRTHEEITTFALWMVRELSRPITLEGQEMRLSVSTGISLFPDDAAQAHDLLLLADRAMYAVKRTGKNGHRFYGDQLLGVDEPRQLIEKELRHARERGELSLMFQPICDLHTGEPHSVEVLIRWHNNTVGRIGPDVFIPIAEESGLIGMLGEWVLASALAAAQVWQAEGFDHLRVAVNVSPVQLMQSGFVEMVENLLESYDLPPSVLELEVTEGVDLHQRSQVMHCLQHLRELGVVLSLDDFGTGFASLSRLNELPVQVVKIDKLFVSDLTGDQHEERTRYVRTLISAMVGVASSLHLALVVEGVETDQQREQLLALGCSQAQGYLFARPMSEDELRGRLWMQNWAIGAD